MRAAVLADFFNEIGAFQKSPRVLSMSEFGHLADMMRTAIHFDFDPKPTRQLEQSEASGFSLSFLNTAIKS